jgi:hypothetical protein
MPKIVTVTLDGKPYTITEKRSRDNAAWRKSLEGPFQELAGLLESAPGADLTDGQSLAALVRSVSGMLLGSIETVTGLLAEYAPDLPLEDAYDSEILEAFGAVLGLAYPFGSLLPRLRALGSLASQTTQNLPSRPGGDGTMN